MSETPHDDDPRLTGALRALADADAAVGASPEVEARLREAVRAIGDARRRPAAAFLALAASLTAVAGGSSWLVATHPPAERVPSVAVREVATEFLPLTYGHLPVTDAYIVRLEVPRSALVQFGLASADLPAPGQETIDADVLVGVDGIARAVRFVHQVRSEE
jgi:hypothetical protein